uniref:PiggyBac transposable element-derived protein domain-containing protein n=1 Tax=Graphocephala atropunctata TaxID=36148 RepID=A0A1B6KGD1_9HEMI
MDYEREQNRILQMFDEIAPEELEISRETVEEPVDNSDNDSIVSDVNNEQELYNEQHSDSEQSLVSNLEDAEDEIVAAPAAQLDAHQGPLAVRADLGYLGRNNTFFWNMQPVRRRNSRVRRENIVTRLPGPVREASTVRDEISSWKLFFPDDMVNKIVSYTNIKIRSIQQNYGRERDAKETDFLEIHAFLGLLYLAGVVQSRSQNTLDLWKNDGTGVEIFRLTMSVNRFSFLVQNIRFDDVTDVNRPQRKAVDRLYCLREIFTEFVDHSLSNYSHSAFVTVDEMLPNFRGRCKFRVYMPQKPGKYGIKVYACCDAKTYYTSKLEVYIKDQPQGPYRLNNSMRATVMRMVSHLEGTGRNITCDNLFTSIPLAEALLEKRLTMVGTLRKNKPELPDLFVTKNGRPLHSTIFGFTENLTVVSYQCKKTKVVLLLSSMHHEDAIDEDTGDACKPEIITFYNSTKYGVDMNDALQKKYSVSRKSSRWPLTLFYFLLNVGGVNAYIIFKHNTSSANPRSSFLSKLGRNLVMGHMRRRVYESHIPSTMKSRICEIMPLEDPRVQRQQQEQQGDAREGRCDFCPSKKNRKTKTRCSSCNKRICKEHTTVKCKDCSKENEESEMSE